MLTPEQESALRLLAGWLVTSFEEGNAEHCTAAGLAALFPQICFLSVSVLLESPSGEPLLLVSGNLTCPGFLWLVVRPTEQSAALHCVTTGCPHAPERFDEFRDTQEAALLYGAMDFLCAPVPLASACITAGAKANAQAKRDRRHQSFTSRDLMLLQRLAQLCSKALADAVCTVVDDMFHGPFMDYESGKRTGNDAAISRVHHAPEWVLQRPCSPAFSHTPRAPAACFATPCPLRIRAEVEQPCAEIAEGCEEVSSQLYSLRHLMLEAVQPTLLS